MTTLSLAKTDTLRGAELPDLVALLGSQADIRYDVVANAKALRYECGHLVVEGGAARIDDEGVTSADAKLRLTQGCEDQVADRLEIPTRYVRKMRADAVGRQARMDDAPDRDQVAATLLDHNVNHWLRANPSRTFLVRAFRDDDPDSVGIARAFLSDRYGSIDNLDVLVAALDGVRRAGVNINIDGCDLSEQRMSVRVSAPEVSALAPELLKGYRSPFSDDRPGGGIERIRALAAREGLGYEAGEEPVVFAGFVISNSEVGGGAFSITPRVIVQICRNGLTIKADALRQVHLGARLDEGLIRWSDETQRKSIDLVTAKAQDAVTTFLDVEYIKAVVARMEEHAGSPVKDPAKIVERVGKNFGFSEEEQSSILSAFISSGQTTAGGVMQAVTAAAQTISDPDRAADLEASALDVLEFAAR